MISKIKLAVLFLLIGLSSVLRANILGPEPIKAPSNQSSEEVCNLSAPAFLNVMNVGTTWAQLAWAPVSGAYQFHIITREVSTGNVLNDTYVPGSVNSTTISPLPPGTICQSEIMSVCQNGQDGTQNRLSPQYGTPIIDVVECGLWSTEGLSVGCSLGVSWGSGCNISNNNGIAIAFRASDTNDDYPDNYRYFKVFKENSLLHVVKHPITYGNKSINFLEDSGAAVLVKIANITEGSFSTNIPSTNGDKRLFFEVQSGCYIRRMDGEVSRGCYEEERPAKNRGEAIGNDERTSVAAAPNPFTNFLDIQIPVASVENEIKISLYDLRGRLVLSVKTPGGNSIQSISTENIMPGLYLLRVDTGDKSETIKVLKTQ